MLQAVQRFLQGGFLFREMKPDQMPDRFPEKTGARYSSDADLFRKLFAEAQIIVITKFADIQQDIISGMKNTICCGCSRKEHSFSSYRQDWR